MNAENRIQESEVVSQFPAEMIACLAWQSRNYMQPNEELWQDPDSPFHDEVLAGKLKPRIAEAVYAWLTPSHTIETRSVLAGQPHPGFIVIERPDITVVAGRDLGEFHTFGGADHFRKAMEYAQNF